MSRLVEEHRLLVTALALLLVLVFLLVLLSWGLVASNIMASMAAGAGLAVEIVAAGVMLLVPDNTRPQATERTLRVASNTLEHMRGGLTPSNCATVCQLLLPETSAQAVAITNTDVVLAYEGVLNTAAPAGSPNSWPTKEVLSSKRMETFVSMDTEAQHFRRFVQGAAGRERVAGIIVPLVVKDEAVGTIKLYYRSAAAIDRTQQAIARGLGELLSTQLSAYELDRQAELTAKAELRALQAQINPHFLFNALNTMASLTRTDPPRARELLREFSVFYRRTLEATDQPIPLSSELEQTRRYLKIEQARFGEERIVEREYVGRGCEGVMVPSFIVQPIVENAVRHAMRDEGPLHIDVHATVDGPDVLISVADDGLGMSEETRARLASSSGDRRPVTTDGRKGAGVALRNVSERIRRSFGPRSEIEIVSRPNEGTCVTLRLADVAPNVENTKVAGTAAETE